MISLLALALAQSPAAAGCPVGPPRFAVPTTPPPVQGFRTLTSEPDRVLTHLGGGGEGARPTATLTVCNDQRALVDVVVNGLPVGTLGPRTQGVIAGVPPQTALVGLRTRAGDERVREVSTEPSADAKPPPTPPSVAPDSVPLIEDGPR